jgi:C1A family cysteine protease
MESKPLTLHQLQATLEAEGKPWEAIETNLFLLPDDEKKSWLGYVPGPGEPTLAAREVLATANLAAYTAEMAALAAAGGYGAPASFDWRNVNGKSYVSPIRNQGGCGSCVAFGTTATVEGTLRVVIGDAAYPIDLSEAHLFYCHARAQGRNCGNGWWLPPALDAYKNPGVADEACYPYTAGDQNCTNLCSDWANRVTRISGWHAITSIADMKAWLSTRGPLDTAFTVYNDFFAYRSGVYRHVSGGVAGGHCVCCVGYNDAEGCWIMENSWGASFGESGYFRIAYGQCGIDATMWAVDGFATGVWQYNKRVVGLWTIDQDRNAWVFIDGIGWKKVSPDNDNIFFNMLNQLAMAKAAARPINYYELAGVIKEVYVL